MHIYRRKKMSVTRLLRIPQRLQRSSSSCRDANLLTSCIFIYNDNTGRSDISSTRSERRRGRGGGNSRDMRAGAPSLPLWKFWTSLTGLILKGRNYYSIILTLQAAIHGDHRLEPVTLGGSWWRCCYFCLALQSLHKAQNHPPPSTQTCVATAKPYKPPNAKHAARLTKKRWN